ncbi:MAG: transposase [Deltaproteobacteria bacterium]|nr:transposase [Deltaproteobacteria bacterium]
MRGVSRAERHRSRREQEKLKERPEWSALEEYARLKIQGWTEELLKEEVTELLGRRKSERRVAVDGAAGYRNGYGKRRRVAMMCGTVVVKRPRVRGLEERFESRILPLFKRRTEEVGELLPQLYLHGLAQGDFELALRGLLGDGAPLSASSIERLREKWQQEFELWRREATQRGANSDDYGAGCPDTGNGCVDFYAVSIPGVTPSRRITWFQAAAACRNAGKELLPNHVWQAAALGTPDPGESAAGSEDCNTRNGGGAGVRGDQVSIHFKLVKGKRGEHVHAYVDGELMGMFKSGKGTLTGIAPGKHTLVLRVVARDHVTELDAQDSVKFEVNK